MTDQFRDSLQHPRIWQALGLFWTGVIVIGCFTPGQPAVGLVGFDKLLHAAAFCGLALWFGSIYRRKRHLWVVLLLAALGLGIEYAQQLTEFRSGERLDFAADLLGILLGITLARTRLAYALRYIETRVLPAGN